MGTKQALEQSAGTEVQTSDNKALQGGRDRELSMAPAVDIFEDDEKLTVQADMPGVSKDTLNVKADASRLLIEGDISVDAPADTATLYADLRTRKYRRTFSLSGELDTDQVSAELKNGVLTIRIPKRAAFRPRQIQVNVA